MNLNPQEENDFVYLLTILPALENDPEFAWLPELFSIIGYSKLITLSKYCGGESIKIPTLEQLLEDLQCLQYAFNISVKRNSTLQEVPDHLIPKVLKLVNKLEEPQL